MTRKGQRDLSKAHLTRHAVDRFIERFGITVEQAEPELRIALTHTRRIGRNPANSAVAALALHRGKVLVAIFQDDSCTTVLTWPQFEPKLVEFGRMRMPRKRGRMLRRLEDTGDAE